jgi:CheY-like chemotaxis protein
MLGSIQSSGRALMDILNDILDYSKIEAGRLHLEPADLDPMRVVRDVVTVLAPQAAGKGLILTTGQDPDAPPAVRADPGRLRQVLFNLVGNAIKFTSTGSVSVRLSRVPGGCRFAVSDTGVGIAEADMPRLFQRFSQVDASPGRRHGGTGLGLAISRHLAEAMGGSISVTSQTGAGSVFAVVIPAAAAPTTLAASHDSGEMPRANRPMRLLVAEDNPVNQRVARALLGGQGHQVVMSANGIEAVAAWRSGMFDAIFMDVQMPEMDGLTASRSIRRLEAELARPRTPIFALTASAMTDERAGCLAAGMDDLVAKPVTGAALARMLSTCP